MDECVLGVCSTMNQTEAFLLWDSGELSFLQGARLFSLRSLRYWIAAAIKEVSGGRRKQCTLLRLCFLQQEGETNLRQNTVPLGVEPPEGSYWREKGSVPFISDLEA